MKALTLTQPWATLVAIGAKRIETRSWSTSYRGQIAIHAGAGLSSMTRRQFVALCDSEPFASALRPYVSGYTPEERAADLPRGVIVAAGLLTDVHQIDTRRKGPDWTARADDEHAFGNYAEGRFMWRLSNVVAVQPLECRGALGLWTPPTDVFEELLGAFIS